MMRVLMMLLIGALAVLPAARARATESATTAPSPAVVSAILTTVRPGLTRLVVETSERPAFSVSSVGTPSPAAVLDLDDVRFAVPGGTGAQAGGLIARFRYGEVAPGKSRIVVDMTGPFQIERAFWLPPLAGQKGRLVLDFVAADQAPIAASAAASPSRAARSQPPGAADTVAGGGRPVVVIDPGHGGIDPGTIGASGTLEKDVTLAFAEALRAELERRGRVDVRLTRVEDRYLTLSERVRIAHADGAGLFLSIHADSAPEPYVRGATVYTLSAKASDSEAAAIAIRENLADSLGGAATDAPSNAVAEILTDLTRRETRTFTSRFATLLVRDLSARIQLIESHPHRSANFKVLTAGDIPSALLELGYLSNPEDERLLLDPRWRQEAVRPIADAVEAFFRVGLERAEVIDSKLMGSGIAR